MPQNKGKPPSNKPPTSSRPFRFVDYGLSNAEKDAIREWTPTLDELDSLIMHQLAESRSVSLKNDKRSGGYCCFMVCQDESSSDYNLCLAGRGSTPLKALKQALSIDRLLDGVWRSPDIEGMGPNDFND